MYRKDGLITGYNVVSRYYHDRYHLGTFGKRLDREADILEGLEKSYFTYSVKKQHETTHIYGKRNGGQKLSNLILAGSGQYI